MLEWKKAKNFLNEEFFKRIGEYDPYGPKEDSYSAYQRLRFIDRNISAIEPEDVDLYSIPLGKIFRWLLQALQVRIEDV